MIARTDKIRLRRRLYAASLLVRLAHVIAPARMGWWVGTPVARALRRLAQRLTR
jgi:hypothetical protein